MGTRPTPTIEHELTTTRAAIAATEADLGPLTAALPALAEARSLAQDRHDRAQLALAGQRQQAKTRWVLVQATGEMIEIDASGQRVDGDLRHIVVVQPGDERPTPLALATRTAQDDLTQAVRADATAQSRHSQLQRRIRTLREREAQLVGELTTVEARRAADRRLIDSLAS